MRKQALTKIFASALLLMFVNFMFSNVIFTHVHKDVNGNPITHSHPYIPNSGHTHSGSSINLLSGFNLSANATISSSAPVISKPITEVLSLIYKVSLGSSSSLLQSSSLRGPPSLK